MSTIEEIILIIFCGLFGGGLNCILGEQGILMPSKYKENDKTIIIPGFFGNLALGVGASFVIWGLGACDFDLHKKLAVCMLSAIGGGSILTNMLQKREIGLIKSKNIAMDELVRNSVTLLQELNSEKENKE